jgi:hypothetical protein
MILLRPSRPVIRLLAVALLVSHWLVLATAGTAHGLKPTQAGVAVSAPEAPAPALGHDELCCPLCQLASTLPARLPARTASIAAVAARLVSAANTAVPNPLDLFAASSPRAPPTPVA